MQKKNTDTSFVLSRSNTLLNEQEYKDRKIFLESYPPSIFLQLDAPCNQDCLFCSRPETYAHFDFCDFRRNLEEALAPAIQRAERLFLTGSGELLTLPRAREILAYFNQFSHAEKIFATNGCALTPKWIDFIGASDNRFTIHISLHAMEQCLHRRMTRSDTFTNVMRNLDYIRKVKKSLHNAVIKYIFVATTENIHHLPDFIQRAAEHGADGVVVYYNYIYRLDQKRLNCFFRQQETNNMLDLAAALAARLSKENGRRMHVALPNKFGQASYPPPPPCIEAWTQIMVNAAGDIITCDVAGDSHETIAGKKFIDVWNGSYYASVRNKLLDSENACSCTCFRANPASINDFRSHFITRGKSIEDIEKFMEGV